MTRFFLLPACTCSLLLLGSLVSGFLAHDGSSDSSWFGRRPHVIISEVALIAALGLHAAVWLTLHSSTNRCFLVATERKGSDRLFAQATKNRNRARPFAGTSVALVVFTAITGLMIPSNQTQLHLGISSFMVAFNLGTFVVEYASIAAQSQLSAEIVTP
jgi:hypothetical protein